MALQIRLNGTQLELAPKSKLSMELINPHFMYDSIPQNVIKAPVFPASPRNREVMGWFEEPQSGGSVRNFLFEALYNGELIREGYYYLKEGHEQKGYTGDFDDKMTRFFGDYQELSLREIDFGTLPIAATPTYNDLGMLAYCRPTIINPDFYGTNGGVLDYTGKMNDYFAGGYIVNTPKVPMFFVAYIIKKIAQITGTTISGNFFTHNTWNKLILYNTYELGSAATDIKISSHLPDMKLTTFFLELRKLPNLKFSFSTVERKMNIDFWEDDLLLPAITDWSSKTVHGETKRPETAPRIQLGYELDGGDGLMKDKPTIMQDYVSPSFANSVYDNIVALKSKFSTTLVDDATNLPIVKQVGISDYFAQSSNKFAPRLLFWNGFDTYPRALPKLNNIELYWNGANGLRAKCWSNTEALRAEQFYLAKQFVLNERDLATLDFSRKYHVNGMNYFIGSLSTELPMKGAVSCLLIGGC